MPGHVWVQDNQIDYLRQQFLREIKHPKVVLKDESTTKALHYIFTKADEQKGTCVIHSMPQDADSMILWMQNLNIGMVNQGEGLQALTYKVLHKLMKQKERTYLDRQGKHELREAHGYACASCRTDARLNSTTRSG